MRIGAADAPPILFLPPLFEEMNRTRALLAATMRSLAARGFGCWLPDLPGTGESERGLEACDWAHWTNAAAAAAERIAEASGRRPALASLRGGCLLDSEPPAPCRWRFAPVAGAALVRDLERAAIAGGGELAGYPVPAPIVEALRTAEPGTAAALRTVRLASDPAEADHKVAGPALWRRSEPGNSFELADAIALDIEIWVRQCDAS
jgi:pimeloyl-ACP methyl ester carboxylesterase